MRLPLLRTRKTCFHDPRVFGLCVLAIVVVLVLFALSRDGQPNGAGTAAGPTARPPSTHPNRATPPVPPSRGRFE